MTESKVSKSEIIRYLVQKRNLSLKEIGDLSSMQLSELYLKDIEDKSSDTEAVLKELKEMQKGLVKNILPKTK